MSIFVFMIAAKAKNLYLEITRLQTNIIKALWKKIVPVRPKYREMGSRFLLRYIMRLLSSALLYAG